MQKIILTVGISGSGKSTWAEKEALEKGYALVSRDNIRKDVFGTNGRDYYEADDLKNREEIVSTIQDTLIRSLLDVGKSIIVDNTHLKAKYIDAYYKYRTPIQFQLFMPDLNECLRRDSEREKQVGEDVIRRQYQQYNSLFKTISIPNTEPREYAIADTHYHHRNICAGTTQWSSGVTRPFKTLEEMNDSIAYSINRVLLENDVLYHLGDWSFGSPDKAKEFFDRINCKHIHLILGNHDWESEDRLKMLESLDFISISHYKEILVNDTLVCMSHFPQEYWNKAEGGSVHLHGHMHGQMGVSKWRRFDVGWDISASPFRIEELIKQSKVIGAKIRHND